MWTEESVSRTGMNSSNQPLARNRGLDYARAFAIVCIFFIHSMEPLSAAAEAGGWGLKIEKNLLESLVRTGVALFLGISGALLLGKQEPMAVFFRKRMQRVLLPFLFWSIVAYTLSCLVEPPADRNGLVTGFFRAFFTEGVHSIYWFVYLIVGLYLLTPLLRVVCQAGYTGYLVLLTAAVYLLGTYLPSFRVTRLFLSEGTSALLCFVLGFFLYLHRNRKGMRVVAWIAVTVGVLADFLNGMFFHLPFTVEILTASGFLLLFLQIPQKEDSGAVSYVILKTGTYSYGMYLSHFLLISAFLRLGVSSVPAAFEPFIMVLAVWMAEWAMMYVAEKAGLKRLVM